MSDARAKSLPAGWAVVIGLICFAAPVALGLLVVDHVPGVNGPGFFKWPYRHLPAVPLYALSLLAMAPVVVAAVLFGLGRVGPKVALGIGMIGSVGAMFAASACDSAPEPPPTLRAFAETVIDPGATTYLADSWRISRDLRGEGLDPSKRPPTVASVLRQYPKVMSRLGMHTRIRGPGWILTHLGLLSLTGYNLHAAAICGGILLTLAAAAAIPMTAWFARVCGMNQRAAVYAGLLLAACPGFVLIFPMADPGYITWTCLLCGLWCVAVRSGRWWPAVAAGLLMGVLCFFTYNFLVLGVFLLGMALYRLKRGGTNGRWRVVGQCVAAMVSWGVPYVLLYSAVGFNPIAVFRQALQNQHRFEQEFLRAGRFTVPYDLYDHALSTGGVVHLLWAGTAAWLAWQAVQSFRGRPQHPSHLTSAARWAIAIGAVQYLVLAASHLMPMETARVWLFITPMLLLGAGLVMARLPTWTAALILAGMAAATPMFGQNLEFVGHAYAEGFIRASTQPMKR